MWGGACPHIKGVYMALLPGIWSAALPSSKTSLISKVASTYGNQDDEELEAKALEFINAAIDDANTHLWEFNKIQETGLPFTSGVSYIPVTANAYREMSVVVVDAGGNATTPLKLLPWAHFEHLFPAGTDTGTPTFCAYRNLHREGRIYFYPKPNDSNLTCNFTYYRRIPHVDEEDPLQVPREIEQLILHGARKHMAVHLLGASHPDVASHAALEAQMMNLLCGVDKRSPAEGLRFRLYPRNGPYTRPTSTTLPWWWVF